MAKGKAPDRGFPVKSMPGLDPVLRAWFRDAGIKLEHIVPFAVTTKDATPVQVWSKHMADNSAMIALILSIGLDGVQGALSANIWSIESVSGVISIDWLYDFVTRTDAASWWQYTIAGAHFAAPGSYRNNEVVLEAYGGALTVNHSGIMIYAYAEEP